MTVYYSGDSHLGHDAIRGYTNRPFNSVELMDEALILEWNRVVKPSDTVYHLGDFCLGDEQMARRYFLRLNGKILILGNTFHHDKRWLVAKSPYWSRQLRVTILPPIHTMKIDGEFIALCHFPLAHWPRQHYNSWMLHAHCHNRYKPKQGLILDTGVDSAYERLGVYRPFSLIEVRQFMESRKGL